MYKPKYKYIPPAGLNFLTRFYDLLCSVVGLNKRFKSKLVELLNVNEGDRVVDIGCGTGTLLIMAKKAYPEAEFIGIDPDKKVLEIAKRHINKKGLDIKLLLAFAEELPIESGLVNLCISTFVLHHIPNEEKGFAISEMYRVLGKGGRVIIADFGEVKNKIYKFLFSGIEHIGGNMDGLIPKYLEEAGFKNIKILIRRFPAVNVIFAEKE